MAPMVPPTGNAVQRAEVGAAEVGAAAFGYNLLMTRRSLVRAAGL